MTECVARYQEDLVRSVNSLCYGVKTYAVLRTRVRFMATSLPGGLHWKAGQLDTTTMR